jgi:hypothetical protein
MKRNVSVVCVCSAPNCCDTGKIIKETPGSVASGTPCTIQSVFCVKHNHCCVVTYMNMFVWQKSILFIFILFLRTVSYEIPFTKCEQELNEKMKIQRIDFT